MESDIRIVILQRGWVVVGRFCRMGERCFLQGGSVIRDWGTTRGLGELAESGPTEKTKLDPVPEMEFHDLVAIATIRCEAARWLPHLR